MKEIGIHFYIFLLFIFDLLDPNGGWGGRSTPNLFPELLEGVTCSKMGLKLNSPKNIQIMPQFRYLSHLVCEIWLFEKDVFSLIKDDVGRSAPHWVK